MTLLILADTTWTRVDLPLVLILAALAGLVLWTTYPGRDRR